MAQMHVLIPMSGQGTRYQKAGYAMPKPLIPVSGIPMIERLLENFPKEWKYSFVLADNHQKTDLEKTLKKLRPQANVFYVEKHAKGPSFAALKALEVIDANDRVLLSYCDYAMEWDAYAFDRFVQESECDSCLISYRGFHAHYLSPQMYAYSRMNGERVVHVKEKGCFTNDRENEFASAGAYYFKSAKILKEAITYQMQKDFSLGGEYYTSLTVQALLEMNAQAHVRVFEIPYFHQWGTPEDLKTWEYWNKTYQAWNKNVSTRCAPFTNQILMPMAGLGSRFKEHADIPKPFLKITGQPMYRLALESLPQAKHTFFVSLESAEKYIELSKHEDAVFLKETPPGQALSTYEGLKALKTEGDIIISSCDHEIVLEPHVWKSFKSQNDFDAAIFTVKGFPGARRRPQAYAYVVEETLKTSAKQTVFNTVKEVSVKKQISDTPEQDALLVGTFWFKDAKILSGAIKDLAREDVRVNGELYLDSVFNMMIKDGLKVCSIPLEGYINWGDPDSMAEASYWREYYFRHTLKKRERMNLC